MVAGGRGRGPGGALRPWESHPPTLGSSVSSSLGVGAGRLDDPLTGVWFRVRGHDPKEKAPDSDQLHSDLKLGSGLCPQSQEHPLPASPPPSPSPAPESLPPVLPHSSPASPLGDQWGPGEQRARSLPHQASVYVWSALPALAAPSHRLSSVSVFPSGQSFMGFHQDVRQMHTPPCIIIYITILLNWFNLKKFYYGKCETDTKVEGRP